MSEKISGLKNGINEKIEIINESTENYIKKMASQMKNCKLKHIGKKKHKSEKTHLNILIKKNSCRFQIYICKIKLFFKC